MTRYAALVLLILTAGCKIEAEPRVSGDSDYSPIIIIQFRETEISSSLPWDISSSHDIVSASVLFPDDNPPFQGTRQLVYEAIENDMLVALISDSCLDYQISGDHIQIWLDSSGTVRSRPENILDKNLSSAWLENTSRQDILLGLFDMYKPDLILMEYRIPDASSVLRIAEYWTAPDVISRYMVVMFQLPGNPRFRGWCGFAGEGINGSTPYGLTESGLFSTIRLLAGLEWVDVLPDIIPAISILEDTDDIWSNQ
ncbi:MAG: hypothetical protein KAR44_08840 [Candidatus Aegiribacteria sp.]|nr:hypothetical protein [Candidatus Aegiribacteria sp.]